MRQLAGVVFCGALLAVGSCTCTSATTIDDIPGGCQIGQEGGMCESEHCSLTVPAGALRGRTNIVLGETTAPADIAEDTVANRLCTLGPDALSFAVASTLHIAVEEDEVPGAFATTDLVAFRFRDGAPNIVNNSTYQGEAVVITTSGAVTAGVTIFPRATTPGIELGTSRYDAGDAVEYIRNLSSELFRGAFHDGQRFYLSNGGRVLIWNDGVPASPTTPPDVILGKPDLTTNYSEASASNLVRAQQIWSDGTKLVVTGYNRVLIWNEVPTVNFTPANIVLGQSSFTDSAPNGGEPVSATTMSSPSAIASDGERLLIADALNNRVLVWDTFPVLNNQPASYVIGQQDLVSNGVNAGAIPIQQARGVYMDEQRVVVSSVSGHTSAKVIDGFPTTNNPAATGDVGVPGVRRVTPTAFSRPGALSPFGVGGFALRDLLGIRVAMWNGFPESSTDEPDVFLGKPDGFLGGFLLGGISSSTFSSRRADLGVFANESMVVVPDGFRVLIWNDLPTSSYAPADMVIGQPTATTDGEAIDYRGINGQTLASPNGIASANDLLLVSELSNNRVLLFDTDTFMTDSNPVPLAVLGQPDASSYMPNRDWQSPGASTLAEPGGVFTDGTRIAVADTGNNRVLIWNGAPQSDGAAASIVVGQPDFVSTRPNAGGQDLDGDTDSDASAESLHRPTGVYIQNNVLYVADTFNHRVLIYDPVPTQNGAAATYVLGQENMTANDPNAGGDWFSPQANGMAHPSALAFLDGDLLVADGVNNRVLGFTAPLGTNSDAQYVLGQPDALTDQYPNYRNTPGQPGLEYGDSVLVATDKSLRKPAALAVTGRDVYVADSGNHRVIQYSVPANPVDLGAALVIGQNNFTDRIANQNGIGAHSLQRPLGIAVVGSELIVADTDNHRVLTYDISDGDASSPVLASRVHGQVDMLGRGINASSSALGSLKRPAGTSWDGERLWVADRGNHRVLSYLSFSSETDEADLVVGQPELGRDLPNAGASVSATSLAAPSDVFSDGNILVVADRDNHRVLIWNSIPSEQGQAADVVIGQADFHSGLPNRGNGVLTPDADTLFSPQGVHYAGGSLYVSDTGNNRVLVFDTLPTISGTAADRVLCQEDMQSNIGNRGLSLPSAQTCASPTGLRIVGGLLYVADALNNRVLGFVDTTPTGDPAVLVVGQLNFVSRTPVGANNSPDAVTMNSPQYIGYDGATLAIADSGNNRILLYDSLPGENPANVGQAADGVLGQSTFTSNVSGPDYSAVKQPTSVTLIPGPFHSTRVLIADSRKDRLLFFDKLARRDWD